MDDPRRSCNVLLVTFDARRSLLALANICSTLFWSARANLAENKEKSLKNNELAMRVNGSTNSTHPFDELTSWRVDLLVCHVRWRILNPESSPSLFRRHRMPKKEKWFRKRMSDRQQQSNPQDGIHQLKGTKIDGRNNRKNRWRREERERRLWIFMIPNAWTKR